jgi:hypothetical protein
VISKFDRRVFVSLGQFQNFELSSLPIVKVKKVYIADTYPIVVSYRQYKNVLFGAKSQLPVEYGKLEI